MDVVITTAQVPGRKPPLLVTADAVSGDEARLGHRRHGGVARSAATASCRKAGETVVTENGVTIIAPDNLPATMPVGASAVLRPEHLGAAARTWSRTAPSTSTSRRRSPRRPSSPTTARSCSEAVDEAARTPEARRDPPGRPRPAQQPDGLHARDPRRVRGHLQGPGDAPHPADVGRQLDPRDRPRGRDADRRRGRRPDRLPAGASSPSRSRR